LNFTAIGAINRTTPPPRSHSNILENFGILSPSRDPANHIAHPAALKKRDST
jgi:hypothetical protein